ncbi:uncharacterized protein [Asterias amurensis]|uniref:uncharacterized protein n=1 Tax=Asterias amurensis TaxID=7602 RepID=UPI003AB8360A
MPKHHPDDNNNNRRSRSSNWTYEEVCLLTEFMKLHKHQLVGTNSDGKGSVNVMKVKSHYWKEMGAVLVQNGCSARPWSKIRKKWNTVKSDARNYHRECTKTGGGERPQPNRIYDKVLEALSPVAKDGIVTQQDGESDPMNAMPSTSPTPTCVEEAMEIISNAIIQDDSRGRYQEEEEEEETDDDEESLSHETACPQETTCPQNTGQHTVCPPPVTSKPHQKTVMQLERDRLDLDQERLQVDKEHLQVLTQISGSLKDISENLKMFLNGITFNIVNSPAADEP